MFWRKLIFWKIGQQRGSKVQSGLLLIVILGCAHRSNQLNPSLIARLEKGQESGDVRALFGSPDRVEKGENGKTLEVYETDTSTVRDDLTSRVLEYRALHVLYDASGALEKFAHYTNRITGKPGTKWRAGIYLSDDDLLRIVKDATTAEELVEYFGPPTSRWLSVFGENYLIWQYQEGRGTFRKTRRVSVAVDTNSVVRGIFTRDISPEKDL